MKKAYIFILIKILMNFYNLSTIHLLKNYSIPFLKNALKNIFFKAMKVIVIEYS